MRRLPARFAPWLIAILLSGMMSCLISGVATARNKGLTPDFLGAWMAAWVFSWPVAFTAMSLLLPVVRGIVGRIVEPVAQTSQQAR